MNEVLKRVFLVPLIISLSILSACAHSMIGKTLPARNYPFIGYGDSGHHIVKFEGGIAELDYYWTINKEEETLTLKGKYNIYDSGWKAITNAPWQGGGLTFEAYLMNSKYEVIEVEHVFIPIDDTTYESNEFEKTFPYKPDYKYISYKMSYSASYTI